MLNLIVETVPSVENAIGSSTDIFNGRWVLVNDWLVYDTFTG